MAQASALVGVLECSFSCSPRPTFRTRPESDCPLPHALLLFQPGPLPLLLPAVVTSTPAPYQGLRSNQCLSFQCVSVYVASLLCTFCCFATSLRIVQILPSQFASVTFPPIVPYRLSSCSLLAPQASLRFLNTPLHLFLPAPVSAAPEHPSPRY